MQPLRIAFCGSSGTGKTTLARGVAERLCLQTCPIGSREVSQQMGFASPYDVDKAGRRAEFQERLIQSKVAWEAEHDSFVTDRTTIDNMIYSMLHGALKPTDTDALDYFDIAVSHTPYSAQYVRTALAGFNRYTHVFFCPMICFFNPGDDPARLSDPDYHARFEQLLSRNIQIFSKHLSPGPRIWTAGIACDSNSEKRLAQVLELIALDGD